MNILTTIDFSEVTDKIMRVTAKLARSMDAKVWLVHVAEPEPDFIGYEAGPGVVRGQVADEYRRQHKDLQALADILREEGLDVTALLIQGAIIDTVIEQCEKHAIELIVTGSHGHGAVYDILVGSISEGIIRRAPCPVTVVPAKG